MGFGFQVATSGLLACAKEMMNCPRLLGFGVEETFLKPNGEASSGRGSCAEAAPKEQGEPEGGNGRSIPETL